MAMHAIDTLQYTEDLKGAGMSESQAQAMARAHDDLFRDLLDTRLATKQDLEKQSTELRSEMTEMRSELKSDISEFRTELKDDISELRTKLEMDNYTIRSEMAGLRTEMYRQTFVVIGVLGSFMAILTYFN